MTMTLEKPTATPPADAPEDGVRRGVPRWGWALGVLAVWIVGWALFKDQHTLVLPGREHTDLHDDLTGFRDSVLASRDSNPVVRLTYEIGSWFNALVEWCQRLVAVPAFPRPVPQVGWLGVTALATWIGLAIAGWRSALLIAASFLSFGAFGYWAESMDLLIITLVAVGLSFALGLPLAVLYGTGGRTVRAVMTIVLDTLQTMPTYVYLIPVVLFFGIGASGAVVCTLAYALPPIVRIAGHGIRSVSPTTIEATDAAGQTSWQRLTKVQLPMARRTIAVGLNQTTMAALSMATLASIIDGPGLGQPVYSALTRLDIGGGFVPGALIVVMAVMLDRTTTAASERTELLARSGSDVRRRRALLLGGLVPVVVAIVLSRREVDLATFPKLTWGARVADAVDDFFTWFADTFGGVTEALRDLVSVALLNPLQSLLADSPWWLVAAAVLALAGVVGGWRGVVPTVVCLAGILLLDLWHDAMLTLTMTVVGTLLVLVLAVVLGVWMARSRRADLVLRPLLDAGQTIPPFVYLIPVLSLFGTSRFTAIFAGVVYAAPVAIKLVADGIAGVSATTLEASRSTGATTWQEIVKVQLPMARGSLVLAANQGLLYVLAMVVIGGLVGAQALGYDVVLGFSRSEEWGKGAAAGLTIVLLGIMIDRIARAWAREV